MSGSTFGNSLRITTFGESHGLGIGAVLDGVESGFPIDPDQIQAMLDRRKPQGDVSSTPRKESDHFSIESGVFEGKTTGTPICIIIRNQDARSADYEQLKGVARPGHADLPYAVRYQNNDYRGGGRASGRCTASIVAAGAIALQILKDKGITINSRTTSVGGVVGNPENASDVSRWDSLILKSREKGETVGGTVKCIASGLPVGIGEPVFDKLDAVVAHGVLSIPAVKGIQFGSGFSSELNEGSMNNLPGNSGGVLGGLSDGEDLEFSVAVKPVPSVDVPQVGTEISTMKPVPLQLSSRHDWCICFRICPVVEAMTALSLLDLWYQRYGR